MVKNPLANAEMQEMWVQALGLEDLLEEEMATHSSILAWRIEWTQDVSFRSFPNSSGWWWLISSIFLIRSSCHETTHVNGYYGAWPGWAVSIT